jgi:hypothetical protein
LFVQPIDCAVLIKHNVSDMIMPLQMALPDTAKLGVILDDQHVHWA